MKINTSITANMKVAMVISLSIAVSLMVVTYFLGNVPLFLLLNTDLGNTADQLFRYITNLGDGICWIAWLVVFILFQRKLIPLLVAAFALSTLYAQGIKNFLFPHQPRPTGIIHDLSLVHVVSGVELHKSFSFPSGHTTTAFTFYFIACLVIHEKWIIGLGLIYALLVAYSRIYLAQHFPIDIAGGIVGAFLTTMLSIWIQQYFDNAFNKNN